MCWGNAFEPVRKLGTCYHDGCIRPHNCRDIFRLKADETPRAFFHQGRRYLIPLPVGAVG